MTTNGNIKIYSDYASNLRELKPPLYPYTVTIDMACEVVEDKRGRLYFYDHGEQYDRRSCVPTFLITEDDAWWLGGQFGCLENVNGWECQYYANCGDLNFEGTTQSGFFPFGPDKGNLGIFKCSADLTQDAFHLLSNTYKNMYEYKIKLYNCGAYPAYTFVTNTTTQGITGLGTVSNIRTPLKSERVDKNRSAFFSHFSNTSLHRVILPRKVPNESYPISYAPTVYSATVDIVCDTAKAQRLLYMLTSTNRFGKLVMSGSMAYRFFGYDRFTFGEDNITVYAANTTINVTHTRPNEFTIPLTFYTYLT